MTQYEKIKQMSLEEMALCFYTTVLPFLEANDYTKQEKYEAYKSFIQFLKSEV